MGRAAAAAADPDQQPGLITVESGLWVEHLSVVRATCSALHDGLRYRNLQIHVGSTLVTAVLSRAEAGERGAPYRDLTALTA
ncbi:MULTISPECIES: hypothetical protein [unclassified Brevundimonas]|uniref:hypothetical protein n=1 Tax=unclassified Brevundimonas TaxID=2622653 RepID=UPI0025BF903C|nr:MULTISPECIES: hypothetical protein [unclassified Brevundimonas]